MTIAGCESQTGWQPNQAELPNVTNPNFVYFPVGQHINAAKSKPLVASSFSSSLCCQRSGPELYLKPGNSLRECIDKIRPTSKLPAIVHQTHPEISMAPSSLLLSANYLRKQWLPLRSAAFQHGPLSDTSELAPPRTTKHP